MSRPLVRISVLVTAGLVVAVVCFGLLESTASGDSGPWTVGGAFAGFIITVLVLNRVWAEETSFTVRAKAAGAEIVYEEVVKVLDLHGGGPDVRPQVAPLSNYYLVDRTSKDRDFFMHFATNGTLESRGSPTHPHTFDWSPVDPEDTTDEDRFVSRYKLRIGLGEDPVGVPTPVLAEVAYTDAFTNLQAESLETHIDEATRHVSMIVILPEPWSARSATIEFHSEGRNERPRLPDPRLLQDGAIVHWSMSVPPQDSRLVLKWSWQPR